MVRRFLKVFGPLAIVLGAIGLVDGVWGLIAERSVRAMRPFLTGSFLLIVGVFMVREARATRPKAANAARPNGEL